MMTCSTTEDFLALRAMLLENEFSYDRDISDDIKSFWEDVVSASVGDVETLLWFVCR